MSYEKMNTLVQNVITELGLVPGADVQLYTEPMIERAITVAYQSIFDKNFWNHLTVTTSHDLDGVEGVVTDELSNIEKEGDIEWVRFAPYSINETIQNTNQGDTSSPYKIQWEMLPWAHKDFENKKLRFYPNNMTGSVKIRARRKINIQGSDSIIPLDEIMLTHLATAHILAADGLFPNAEARHQALFEQRYIDLISNQSNGINKFSMNPASGSSQTFTVEGT